MPEWMPHPDGTLAGGWWMAADLWTRDQHAHGKGAEGREVVHPPLESPMLCILHGARGSEQSGAHVAFAPRCKANCATSVDLYWCNCTLLVRSIHIRPWSPPEETRRMAPRAYP